MKKIMFLALILSNTINVFAQDVYVDGIHYQIRDSNAWVSRNSNYSGIAIIQDSIIYEGEAYRVTQIGEEAFIDCKNLKYVSIPNTVTNIGRSAFRNAGITSIVIPSSVTYIEDSAFDSSLLNTIRIENATPMTYSHFLNDYSVLVPAGSKEKYSSNESWNKCKEIKEFCEINDICYSFDDVTHYAKVISLPDEKKYTGVVEIPSIVTFNNKKYDVNAIAEFSLFDCSTTTSVAIPNSVETIGKLAFYGCSGLTSITIPNSVTNLGYGAFENCTGLTSITIPNNVTSIEDYAFSHCKLRNFLVQSSIPPTLSSNSFSNQSYYHSTLYIPVGSWEAYAYDKDWYMFINMRETAFSEEQLSEQQAYMLMDANTFTYSVYDPVNNCIGHIGSESGIDENNPNHSWQMIDTNGAQYLYNIGAKKFATTKGNKLALSDMPEPITMNSNDNGIVMENLPDHQWAFVCNDNIAINQTATDEITGMISPYQSIQASKNYYNLNGCCLSKPLKGVNIIRFSDGTIRKVLIR